MIKTVFFDWNGTLLADGKAVLDSFNKELAVYGYSPLTMVEFQAIYDIPITNMLSRLGVDPELVAAKKEQANTLFHANYEPRAARARTRQGTREVLSKLKGESISLAILSNHTVEGIYLQLERLKLTSYFSAVLANEGLHDSYKSGKQHRLEKYLKDQGLLPHEALIIGDGVEEVAIGRNVGLKTVAITGGHTASSRLRAAQPDYIIHTLTELMEIVERL